MHACEFLFAVSVQFLVCIGLRMGGTAIVPFPFCLDGMIMVSLHTRFRTIIIPLFSLLPSSYRVVIGNVGMPEVTFAFNRHTRAISFREMPSCEHIGSRDHVAAASR